MQAYQSPPCPYCGATWNQPGAQACANCRNALPPPQPSYAPPGYAQGPPPGQQPGFGAPYYPPQNYPQQPQYPGAPPGYPGQPGEGYAAYGPPGYPQQPGVYGPDPGYGAYAPQGQPPVTAGTTLRLFGQTFTVPVALPPALLQYQDRIVRGAPRLAVGVVVAGALLVLFLGVTPAVASSQISAANLSMKMAASRQDKIDAIYTQALTVRTIPSDANAAKAQFDKLAKSFNDGLSLVQSDEAAITSVDQRLTVLQWLAPSRGAAVTDARHRLGAALGGLKQADQALTAAANEVKVMEPYNEARLDYAKMSAALAKRDLVGAGAPYPDAQQKIELAISYSRAAGVPSQLAKQVNSFGDVLTNTESLVQATQAKDAAGIKKYTDAANTALKAMSSPDEAVSADYETKTFGPMQKAYDAAMKAIKSGS